MLQHRAVSAHRSGPTGRPHRVRVRAAGAELDTRLRSPGLTPTQFMVLATVGWLEHLDGPPTQQQVADNAGTDRQMTSRVVRALQDRGLITRHPHESHARSLRLSPTPRGRTHTGRASEVAQALDGQLFGPEPTGLRATLRAIAEFRTTPQHPSQRPHPDAAPGTRDTPGDVGAQAG